MAVPARTRTPKRQLESAIIHFDYDCFYASVFERENPSLKSLPLAVQQKQIVVTCNYEARRRGLYKLQLISEAKKVCPDVVIVLGEDLTRFRDASKELYGFLRSFSWNSRCERLGFDEVFMDVSDLVAYNASLLNPSNLEHSFFCLSKTNPQSGFPFNASSLAGYAEPSGMKIVDDGNVESESLRIRLALAGHLAQYLRQRLETEKGYTATVGISTNKLLAKLVGNLHKPNGQTTLLPPYVSNDECATDNVTAFVDEHEIGKIPGIGFKIAQKLRAHVLQRPADFNTGLVYGGTKENVRVRDVKNSPGMGPALLERLLGGHGAQHGIGTRVWDLVNGCDDSPVNLAREVPTQISVEDSYIRLDTVEQVVRELRVLGLSLLQRMHADLLEDDVEDPLVVHIDPILPHKTTRRWKAHPRTIRLSTRPRPPQNPDGSRNRSFARISKSTSMPNFVFGLREEISVTSNRLVDETLLPLFRQLHPEKNSWNLSLINIAAANIVNAAKDKGGEGQDISRMFKRQSDGLSLHELPSSRRTDLDCLGENDIGHSSSATRLQGGNMARPKPEEQGSEDFPTASQVGLSSLTEWGSEDEAMVDLDSYRCPSCGAVMPQFAMGAHIRWHVLQ